MASVNHRLQEKQDREKRLLQKKKHRRNADRAKKNLRILLGLSFFLCQ